MAYAHTQRAPLHILLWLVAAGCAYGAWALRTEPIAVWSFGAVTVSCATFALCFRSLTVRDAGDALAIAFGPLPVFRKRVPYASIQRAEPARSKIIDGWGIHWMPGRGWTWNLWGMDCVELHTEQGLLRIGTDDPAGLAAFVSGRVEAGPA